MQLKDAKRQWQLRHCQDQAIKHALSAPYPDYKRNWKQTPWLAVDLETTSLEAKSGEIVSIGWVAIENGAIPLSSMQRWLVKPEGSVGQSATIHYLRDEDLAKGQGLRHALTALATAMSGRVCIFHNKQLDISFLEKAFQEQFSIGWFWPTIDTLKLEWKRLQRSGTTHFKRNELRLSNCRKRYQLPDYPLHDASHDALACAELFIAWASHSGGLGPSLKDCLRWS
ncbi:MAG: 3'-5' exonuclease [Pseudomonadales bacterium]|nr:3'-5' exonuclease [Pseudomonadales bacterium]